MGEEVLEFKRTHGEDRVLALIVAGRPNASARSGEEGEECFPLPLRFRLDPAGNPSAMPTEPIAADLRPGGDGKRLALLKLVAGILQVNLDELVNRDNRRRNRQLVALAAAASALSVVFASLALIALQSRNEAVAQRAQAEGLVEFMIGDLRKKLAPAGRLDVLDAVGARALTYYDAQEAHGMEAVELGRRARVLHMLGEIRDRRGDLAGAMKRFEEASESTGELLRREPADPARIFDHAQSVYWIGYIAWRRGQDEICLRRFSEYLRLANQLYRIDPKNEDWQLEADYANSNLGTALLSQGRIVEAKAAFETALRLSRRLAEAAPQDRDRQVDLAQSYAWLADAEALNGQVREAMILRDREAATFQRLLSATPGDNDAIAGLALSENAQARMSLSLGRKADAIVKINMAAQRNDEVLRENPEDATYLRDAATIHQTRAQALLEGGELAGAAEAAAKAERLVGSLISIDATLADWGSQHLATARVLKTKIAAARSDTRSGQATVLAPIAAEARRLRGLSDARPRNLELARAAAEAAMLAGDRQALLGRRQQAVEWWRAGRLVASRSQLQMLPETDRAGKVLTELRTRLERGVEEGVLDYRW